MAAFRWSDWSALLLPQAIKREILGEDSEDDDEDDDDDEDEDDSDEEPAAAQAPAGAPTQRIQVSFSVLITSLSCPDMGSSLK